MVDPARNLRARVIWLTWHHTSRERSPGSIISFRLDCSTIYNGGTTHSPFFHLCVIQFERDQSPPARHRLAELNGEV